MTAEARILLIEDDESIRAAVTVSLRAEGYAVRAEADGATVARVAEEFRPDLAILDVRLPAGPDGCAIARLLRRASDLPLLFLTAADSLESRLAGFEAGADDYMVKPFSMAELLVRIHALLRRAGRLSSQVRQIGDLVIDEGARAVVRAGAIVELTRTEFALLSALAQHPGQVLSKVQLLTLVWGFDAYGANLVEVHLSTLRRKLEAHGPRQVHTIRGAGYVLRA
ncbi:MAG: response regulator transcription factor [Actinomycetota bacterium]|nr:response regulator transcription factor [Actinomycetota bacterium]